jgi:hypothetical protein
MWSTGWSILRKRQLAAVLNVVLMVGFASLLTMYTLEIQHSCTPLLDWVEVTNPACQPPPPESFKEKIKSLTDKIIGNTSDNSDVATLTTDSDSQKLDPSSTDGGGTKPPERTKLEIVMGLAAMVGLALMGAPITVTIGAGAAIWLAVRALLKA